MGTKLVVAAAAIVLLAGCSAQEEGGEEASATEDSAASAAPEVVEGQPIEFELTAPSGFAAVEEDRDALVADNHVSYVFALDGGAEGDRIMVTSYVIDEEVAAGDYDAVVAVVAAYDGANDQENDLGWYSHATVHRMPAVHRYLEVGADSSVKQYSHYVAVGTHLIQITCQWESDFGAVMDACYEIEQNFPVPEGWEDAA